MLKDKLKDLGGKHEGEKVNKKKIENIIFLIVVLIITVIALNFLLKDNTTSNHENETEEDTTKTLASIIQNEKNETASSDLEKNLEKILETIKGVGKVNVFINYSESSKIVPMYDEKTTTSATEETDSNGGLRNVTSTEKQKSVIYTEKSGGQTPMTEKVIMPTIEGAIITAKGAGNATVKSNIVSAVEAATGLTIDKIQVFEIEN